MLNKIKSVLELPIRVLGPISGEKYENLEKKSDFYFSRPRIIRNHGVSCMIRAKNEESNIIPCLESIKGVFDEIVFIDNGSSDKTKSLVEEYAKNHPNLSVWSYDISVARCGDEHNVTNENSLKSLAYYYNWCASKCSFSYIFKWDADMILSRGSVSRLKKIINRNSSYWPTFSSIEIQTVYKKNNDYYMDNNEVNSEFRVFPNRADIKFKKGKHFEVLSGKFYRTKRISIDEVLVYEVKDVSLAEFSHWDTDSVAFPTKRKKIEWENYNIIKSGEVDEEVFKKIKI